jgi:hypothetical protein
MNVDPTTPQAIYAQQLLTYADAVTGVAFVQSLTFCYKLADDNFAKKIVKFRTVILAPTIWMTCIYVAAITGLFVASVMLAPVKDPTLWRIMLSVEIARTAVILGAGWGTYQAFAFTRKAIRKAQSLSGSSPV